MRYRFSITTLVAAIALMFGAARTYAQFNPIPYESGDAVEIAQGAAEDSLGATDLMLVGIATSGMAQQGVTGFNLDDGTSSAWAYIHYSPSKQKSAFIVPVQILPTVFLAPGSVNDTTDVSTLTELDMSGTHSGSAEMAAAIRQNSEYTALRQQKPTHEPLSVALFNQLDPGFNTMLPSGFPVDKPIWMVTFGDPDNTTSTDFYTCFVATGTGQTTCLTLPTSGIDEYQKGATADVAVSPNPATGRTRIDVTLPDNVSASENVEVALYDISGRKALDLTETFVRNGHRFVEFDASTLPAGVYYCRATGASWSGTAGIVVGK